MDILDFSVRSDVCAATQLGEYVDEQINGGARQEFADATDETQESGADLGEGSAYLDDSEISFTPVTVICGVCRGMANLEEDGSVDASGCRISGMCELDWATKYPAQYADMQAGGKGTHLRCGAEIGCSALIGMRARGDERRAVLRAGVCQITQRGADWLARRDESLKVEPLVAPEAGIPEFDGQGSGREE